MLRTNNWSNEKIKCCQNLSFLCTNAKQKNGGGVTEETGALLLWQAKGEHSRLVPQEPVPSFWSVGERVTGRKARGLQMEEIACKCQTFLSLLSGRRKQTNNIFFPSLYKFKERFLLKYCVAIMTPGFT